MMDVSSSPNGNVNEGVSDATKSDFILLAEAEGIEKKEKNLKYDTKGNNKNTVTNNDQKRHEEIVKELNSRGIFHKTQTCDISLSEYEVVSTQTVNINSPMEFSIFALIVDGIETHDSICSSCGQTHNKNLSVKSGMEWLNLYFPLWDHRVEGTWSPFSDSFGVSTSEILGNEHDVTLYVQTKSDHAFTTATFTITSDILIKDQWGDWIPLEDPVIKAHLNVYYPYYSTIKSDTLQSEDWLPGSTKHLTTIAIHTIL